MEHLRAFSPEMLREMRSASRSPNKRSAAGASRDSDDDDTDVVAVTPESCLIPAPPPLPAPVLVTPFKRFRADSLLSPRLKSHGSSSSAATVTTAHDRLTRRRDARTFESLADDRFPVVVVKSSADSATSTQNSSLQNSQEDPSATRKTLESSPADVAALCSKLLVCSETLEDQMDALDVGSFLSWRPATPSERPSAASPVLRHRRKPRIRFDDDALRLQDVFSAQTQRASDDDDDYDHSSDHDEGDEVEAEPPVLIAVAHFPLDSGCSCMGGDCDSLELERTWQVYSPPPHSGFDPTCCSIDSDYYESSDDDDGGDDAHHDSDVFCHSCCSQSLASD